jgi:hypothetical protein
MRLPLAVTAQLAECHRVVGVRGGLVGMRKRKMRKGTPKYPQPRDVGPVMQALLHYIPTDASPVYGRHESLKHTPCFRVKGVTNEIPWTVDIYRGHFYHVQVEEWSEPLRTVPALISFLWKRLSIS